MVEEALEYFRSLKNVVFMTKHDDDYSDGAPYIGDVAYRSIDQLIKEEQFEGQKLQAIKNEGSKEIGGDYTLFFETDKNSKRIKKAQEKVNRLEDQIFGSQKEEFEKLPPSKKEKKINSYEAAEINLSYLENDDSTLTIVVVPVK